MTTVSWVSWERAEMSGVSIITEDREAAMEHSGPAGTVLLVIVKDGRIIMVVPIRGEAKR